MKLRSGAKTPGRNEISNYDENNDVIMTEESSKSSAGRHLDASSVIGDDNHIVIRGHRINFVVLITHFNMFLYSVCFWIQIGVMPYLTKKLGVDPVMYGYLQTTFAVVQLCGGPVFGRFGDLFGGRAALTLAFSSAALSYALLGVAYSIPLLFVSRLPSIFMHAMQGGQMVVTDISNEKERADALGKLGLSYGMGMVCGPLIGGLITKFSSEQSAAFAACIGSVLSILMVMKFIPKHTKREEHRQKEGASSSDVFSAQKYLSLIRQPGAFFLLFIRLFSGIPIGIFQSMFSVVAMETFKLPPEQNGMLMSYIGVIAMIVQGVGIGLLTKRYHENTLLKWSAFILIWAYLGLAQIQTVLQLCIVILPLSCGLTTKTVVISSALTKIVPPADTGVMLGLNMAMNSIIRSMSPTVGGYMLEYWGFSSIGYMGFIFSILVTILLFVKLKDRPAEEMKK